MNHIREKKKPCLKGHLGNFTYGCGCGVFLTVLHIPLKKAHIPLVVLVPVWEPLTKSDLLAGFIQNGIGFLLMQKYMYLTIFRMYFEKLRKNMHNWQKCACRQIMSYGILHSLDETHMHTYSTYMHLHAPGILLLHMNVHVTRCHEWLRISAAGSWWAVLIVCPRFLIWRIHAHTHTPLLAPPPNDLAATCCQGNSSHGVRVGTKRSHMHPQHLCSVAAVVRGKG